MNSTNMTLEYYNRNAADFTAGTLNVDFRENQNKFLKMLNRGGSGRDTKYFLEHGMRVEAIDGSIELCRIASEYTGIEVRNMLFQDLNECERYDAIWACSSVQKDLARYDEKDEDKDTDLYKLFNTNTYGEDCGTEKE
mgnify:CR=1 FL=1